MSKSPEFIAKCQHYAAGRVGARRMMTGKTFQEALAIGPRWRPTIARDLFKPSNDLGYETRAEAIAEAQRIKAECQAFAARSGECA